MFSNKLKGIIFQIFITARKKLKKILTKKKLYRKIMLKNCLDVKELF